MAEYFFFLGRNPDLSLQEIISFLESREIEGKYEVESNIALFSLAEEIDPQELIEKLGGTIKIGKVLIKEKGTQNFIEAIKKLKIYEEKNRVKFTITPYQLEEEIEAIKEILYDFFIEEGIKAFYKQPSETPTGSIKFDIEFFAIKMKNHNYFGKIDAVYNAKDAEFRDMHRPFRREELAISPRLAKILITFSGATANSVLLDPFCGVGTILQEALLQDINVIGADIDPGAVENCKRNITWLKKTYEVSANETLFTSSAIDIPKTIKQKVDAIASEPFLVPLITYTPKDRQARKMISRAKEIYITTLKELKKLLKEKGRVALSMPVMKARESKVRVNIEEICSETGLKLIAGPFSEARKDQRVSREFVILEK